MNTLHFSSGRHPQGRQLRSNREHGDSAYIAGLSFYGLVSCILTSLSRTSTAMLKVFSKENLRCIAIRLKAGLFKDPLIKQAWY